MTNWDSWDKDPETGQEIRIREIVPVDTSENKYIAGAWRSPEWVKEWMEFEVDDSPQVIKVYDEEKQKMIWKERECLENF